MTDIIWHLTLPIRIVIYIAIMIPLTIYLTCLWAAKGYIDRRMRDNRSDIEAIRARIRKDGAP